MAAGVEHRVEIFLPDTVQTNCFVELSFRGRVVFEPEREVGA
jgi:hypothetical protein